MSKSQLILTTIASLGLIGSFVFVYTMNAKGQTTPVTATKAVVAPAPQYPAGAKWMVVHRICPQWRSVFAEQKYYASTMESEGGGTFHFINAQTGKRVYISGGQTTITEL